MMRSGAGKRMSARPLIEKAPERSKAFVTSSGIPLDALYVPDDFSHY